MREGIAQVIRKSRDFAVCGTASTADEGLEQLRKLKPDLVLVDITLPGKDGLQFVEEACKMYPKLRILVMSTRDESLYAARILRAGALGYIQKRENSKHLIEAMRRVLIGEISVSKKMADRSLEMLSGRKVMHSPLENLTPREMTVFQLIGEGKTTTQMSRALHVSVKTIEAHRVSVKKRLGIMSSPELIAYAARWRATFE